MPVVRPVRVLLQVADGSGCALLPGAVDYESALASVAGAAIATPSPDDLYVLYTGGTTGMPKGVLWRQADIVVAGLGLVDRMSGEEWHSEAERVEGLRNAPVPIMPCAPLMHGAAQWVALRALGAGDTVVLAGGTQV